MAVPPERRRPRKGSLERPVSGRIYRAAWLCVAVPLLVAAFSVGQPVALQQPRLPPSFDRTTAVQFTTELARDFPDRRPGTSGAEGATDWVEARFRDYKFTVERQEFDADVPGLGTQHFVNLIATAPPTSATNVPRSQEVIAIVAHRDNIGGSPGADYNASSTGALLELARDTGSAALSHTIVLVSTDGDVFGSLGSTEFARNWPNRDRLAAVIDLDAIGGQGAPHLHFAGDTPRTPVSTLLATAEASVQEQAQTTPLRPNALSQLIDLAFPFSLYGQSPFIAQGTPAVTLSTAGARPPKAAGDTIVALDQEHLDQLGRSAQALLGSLDSAADVASGTESYVWTGHAPHPRLDDRVRPPRMPAALPRGDGRPFRALPEEAHRPATGAPEPGQPDGALGLGRRSLPLLLGHRDLPERRPTSDRARARQVAQDWPVVALGVFAGLVALGWLVTRPRLVPTGPVSRTDELGGHLAAMLGLGLVALVVAAQNPFALIFILPSLARLALASARLGTRPPSRPRRLSRSASSGRFSCSARSLSGTSSASTRSGTSSRSPRWGTCPSPSSSPSSRGERRPLRWGPWPRAATRRIPSADERPRRGPIRESIRQIVLSHAPDARAG